MPPSAVEPPAATVSAPAPTTSANDSASALLAAKLRLAQQEKAKLAAKVANAAPGSSAQTGLPIPPPQPPSASDAPMPKVAAPVAPVEALPPSATPAGPSKPAATPLPPLPPPTLRQYQALPSDHAFVPPRKRIVSPASLDRFANSDTMAEILDLVGCLNDEVKGVKIRDEVHESEAVKSILSILDTVSSLIDSTPPVDNAASRFGNPAFRALHEKIQAQSVELISSISGMDKLPKDAAEELSVYLEESWGNAKRIDYGSGMELNFACWLLCLVKLRILSLPQDGPAIVLRIFWRYIQVMRRIQSTYWLEPAGSHGVWGLDDYHFLPFLWGSGQLKDHKHLRPKAIHDEEMVEEFSKDFMYFACIQFINSIKTASLRWHSPMLDDISGVRSWGKVNEGMLKMYKAEVLLKLPIAQHIFFGSLIPYPAGDEAEEDEEREEDEHGHVHAPGQGHAHSHGPVSGVEGGGTAPEGQAAGWGDCCGIPIPSAFAAAREEREKGGGAAEALSMLGKGVRRIPFD